MRSHGLFPALAAGLVALLLRFAFQNHQSADRSPARVWGQGAWLTAHVVLSVVLLASVDAIVRAG